MPLSPVERIQRAYPRVYLACHTHHIRAKSTTERLSAHDSTVLAHLDPAHAVTAGDLACHLGIGKSTMSAALGRLEGLGYIRRATSAQDSRAVDLFLSEAGAQAMAATSVLDGERLTYLLSRLSESEREHAIRGLEVLASAAAETVAHFRPES